MANVLVYYAHPGHRHSTVNRSMAARAQDIDAAASQIYLYYKNLDRDGAATPTDDNNVDIVTAGMIVKF